ncbi:MAG: sensor histidine kinase [Verrucomicrobiota bacterium]
MANAFFRKRTALSLLACGFCWVSHGARAAVEINAVDVEGKPLQVLEGDSSGSSPLQVTSSARYVRFCFKQADGDGLPPSRLRYKLEGYDKTWRDLPNAMRISLEFLDCDSQITGTREFIMADETPGWHGSPERSPFVARSEHVTVPERSAYVRIVFLSNGGGNTIGMIGVDAIRVLAGASAKAQQKIFDLSITEGKDLAHPLGAPAHWRRHGARAEMAQLRTRPVPVPHPILVLNDDDAVESGLWVSQPDQAILVTPGDNLTLEWQTAHSIGSSGPWMASYPQLKVGNYFFRVAVVRANGEPTGVEAMLPLVVTAPLHQRWEFWLALAVVISTSATWAGRLTIQRRLQRRLVQLERERVMERERERIARDLHDNIGAGLTEIAMQSDLVHSELEQGPTEQTRRRAMHIRHSATDLARCVDEIVWVVNPANDTLKRFVSYLTQCIAQFLEAAELRVRFDIPHSLPPLPLAGKVRHALFLAIREAVNNAVKHAQASLVRLEIRWEKQGLCIVVADDGKGFVPAQTEDASTHNGLNNMRRRMEEIHGRFQLTSQPGKGTQIEFFAPLPDEPTEPEGTPDD